MRIKSTEIMEQILEFAKEFIRNNGRSPYPEDLITTFTILIGNRQRKLYYNGCEWRISRPLTKSKQETRIDELLPYYVGRYGSLFSFKMASHWILFKPGCRRQITEKCNKKRWTPLFRVNNAWWLIRENP